MNTHDRQLLERWLALIDRLRSRGAINDTEHALLRAHAIEAVAS